ncbi:uncharacterized protein [Mytilus edulis]|uniref:uncharacterized protein n=1 Tax=Mytilus edulis TaxID=6550 RepID=UPI0039EE4BC7
METDYESFDENSDNEEHVSGCVDGAKETFLDIELVESFEQLYNGKILMSNGINRRKLEHLMNDSDLYDIWRFRNPKKRVFSRKMIYSGVLKQSRLDYCLSKLQRISERIANGEMVDLAYYENLKMELSALEEERCKGAILRSKAYWATESDKFTKYFLHFLQLEKHKQESNCIKELLNDNNESRYREMWYGTLFTQDISTSTPGKSTTTPDISTTTPGISTKTPGNITTTPRIRISTTTLSNGTITPDISTSTPGIKTTTPGNRTTTPSISTTTLGNSTTTLGNGTTTPGNSTTTPDISTTTPDISSTTSGNSTTTPDISTTTPDISSTTSGNSTTTPGKSTTPAISSSTPGISTTTPSNGTTTQGIITTTPCNSTTTPGNSTTTPGIRTTTPCTNISTPIIDTVPEFFLSGGITGIAAIGIVVMAVIAGIVANRLWKNGKCKRHSNKDEVERGNLLRPLLKKRIQYHGYKLNKLSFKLQDTGSLLTEGIYCDGYFIDCDIHHSLIGSNSFCKRTAKDNIAIKSNYNFESTNAFECLVITSSYLKKEQGRLSLLNEDSFLQAVVKSRDLICRLMLSYIDDSEATLVYLLKVLEFAMERRHNDISMSIAWRLTWVYFTRIKYDFPTLKDIWPAFRCTCKNESEEQCDICLSETVIVVQLDTYSAKPSEMFYSIPVIFYTDGIGDKLPLATSTIPYIDEMPITDSNAECLFDNHRNLTLICKSSCLTLPMTYRPSNTISEIKPCVQLYCKAKGLIPIGEQHFPKFFCGMPTKVVQGTPTLMGGLQIGNAIGTDSFKKGTLGGFVRFRGEDAFLTCLHVFLTAEQLTEDKITLDDNESYRVKCYQNTTAWSNKDDGFVCGKIQDFGFEQNCDRTSVDAALIQLEKGIGIDSSHFLATTGLESCYLNDICIDYKSFIYSDPRPEITTVSIGAITGMSKTKSNVRVEKAVDTDIEAFNKTFSDAILEGMRAHVVAVIQTLQSRSDPAQPIQLRIRTATDEICGAAMSAETKEGIVEIVACIYPKIIRGDNEDQSEKINQLLHEVTVEKTTSKFSGILSDVHMQTTVLKMTIDSAKRMSRRIYNQIHIPDIPFKMGDSGTCIYVVKPIKGCIGMAIASHPQGGCIATPIMEILKYFKIRFKDSS